MDRAKIACWTAFVSSLFGLLLGAGCQSGPQTAVEPSLTELGAGGAGTVSQLDYLDALEQRSTVTWDELLIGALLTSGRRADGDYTDRLAVARRAGILGAEAPDARTGGGSLATPGDLAKVLLRSQGLPIRQSLSAEEALSLAARRSLMPPTLTASDPLTGAVAVRALAAIGRPAGTSQPPAPPAPVTATSPRAPSDPRATTRPPTKPPAGWSNL